MTLHTQFNLAYAQYGEGFPVVVLHGFCENKTLWTDVAARLSASFTVITPDLPGFGDSTDNQHYASIDAMADEVYQLLQSLQTESCVLIGHSLGGYVALAFAEKYPQMLKGLGLFHSTAFADSEEKKHTRNKTADFIDKQGTAAFAGNYVPPLFYKGRHEALAGPMEAARNMLINTPKETAVAAIKAMRDRPDRTHVLRESACPVLFIVGQADQAVPFEASKALVFMPKHSLMQALAETAHMGMYERPQETYVAVENFCNLCVELQHKGSFVG